MKNKLAIKLINNYKQSKNPYDPPKCKYFPSCSSYALECYKKFNFVYASLLVTKRLLKCTPFSKGGYDPVPLTKEEKLRQKNDELFVDINNYKKNKD